MNLLVTIGTTQENLTRESDLCDLVFHELFTPAPGEFLVCGQIAQLDILKARYARGEITTAKDYSSDPFSPAFRR